MFHSRSASPNITRAIFPGLNKIALPAWRGQNRRSGKCRFHHGIRVALSPQSSSLYPSAGLSETIRFVTRHASPVLGMFTFEYYDSLVISDCLDAEPLEHWKAHTVFIT